MKKKMMDALLAICVLLVLVLAIGCGTLQERGGYDLILIGFGLSAEEADSLEKRVKRNPGNIVARTKLVAYYSYQQFEDPSAQVAKREHVLWLIENAPKSKMLAVVGSELDSDMDPEAYPKGKALWLAHLEKNPEDLSILGNAAEFFFHADKDLAEESLLKAISLDPENPVWPKELGFLYWLGRRSDSAKESKKMAGKALEQYEIAYDLTADNKERSYLLQDLAENAYEAGEIEKADQFARDMLSCDIEDWNTGNNMHHGNIILGKIALQSGEIKKAAEHLIQAGAISGSPQLDSFGPDMTLAEALLEAGESDAVLEYFDYCSRFWELANGCLDIWSDSVEKGETPEFENCRMFGPDWENILEECE